MRISILAALALSGCFDLSALGPGNSVDASGQPGSDLGTTPTDDQGTSGSTDLSGSPVYWFNTFTGGPGFKALRGIGGASGMILAAGDKGGCVGSTDGKAFTVLNPGTNADFTSVWGSAANDIWLVGSGGSRIYHYNGTTFAPAANVPGINYTAVFGVSATQVIAVSSDLNRGAQLSATVPQWMPQDHGYNQRLYGMWGATSRLWAVGENSTAGYYDFGNNSWATKQMIPATSGGIIFRAAWGTSDTDLWVVGDQGNIAHYANGSFTRVFSSGTTNVTADLTGIWGFAANDIWAVGSSGTVLHYDGTSWQPWTSKKDITAGDQLQAIWGDKTNLWTVSTGGNIYRHH